MGSAPSQAKDARAACTCLDEAYDMFAPPCAASYHHWQAILEGMSAPGARIVWDEGPDMRESTGCLCGACRPERAPEGR